MRALQPLDEAWNAVGPRQHRRLILLIYAGYPCGRGKNLQRVLRPSHGFDATMTTSGRPHIP